MDLFVTDDGTDRGSANHDLDRADPAASFHLREQHLCHHSFENEGELRPHLRLLVGREGVDHSVDGLGCGVGMKRCEH